MHTRVYFSDFCDAFRNASRNENFSYEGKKALFNYLEQYEEDIGKPIELDVVALCCDYNEMSWQEVAEYYRVDLEDCEDDEEKIEVIREYLNDNTTLVGEYEVDGNTSFLFAVF